MARLVVLLVLVGAFAPAAVLGALPLLLLSVVSLSAMLSAAHLALPQRDEPGSRAVEHRTPPQPIAG
jgi:hypothetical protein